MKPLGYFLDILKKLPNQKVTSLQLLEYDNKVKTLCNNLLFFSYNTSSNEYDAFPLLISTSITKTHLKGFNINYLKGGMNLLSILNEIKTVIESHNEEFMNRDDIILNSYNIFKNKAPNDVNLSFHSYELKNISHLKIIPKEHWNEFIEFPMNQFISQFMK